MMNQYKFLIHHHFNHLNSIATHFAIIICNPQANSLLSQFHLHHVDMHPTKVRM